MTSLTPAELRVADEFLRRLGHVDRDILVWIRDLLSERDALAARVPLKCRVYWGTHGCHRPRGHAGPHVCDDCFDPADNEGYVGSWPYYGPMTHFYGEDVTEADRQSVASVERPR